MRRFLYLMAFGLILSPLLGFFPIACSNKYSVTPAKTTPIQATPTHVNGGVVTTLAGSGSGTFANGTGTAASFNFPTGVAADLQGNVYVADLGNNLIRKITPGGVVSTLAGTLVAGYADGPSSIASFFFPQGVASDSSGTVYVADQYNNYIRKITPGGVVSTLAGIGIPGYANGPGKVASFNFPEYIAVDSSGYLFIGDTVNSMVREITPACVVSTLAGSGAFGNANGPGSTASFSGLCGVAVDLLGNVYVADTQNCLIRKITPGGVVSTLAGNGLVGSADGLATAASFNNPSGVAVDSSGTVYVADTLNNLIRKITPGGVVSTLVGSGSAGSNDGTGSAASFNNPFGIAIDSSGILYVADTLNNLIRKIQ